MALCIGNSTVLGSWSTFATEMSFTNKCEGKSHEWRVGKSKIAYFQKFDLKAMTSPVAIRNAIYRSLGLEPSMS
jgi:hypothetical protein